jgi:hypothetical protein
VPPGPAAGLAVKLGYQLLVELAELAHHRRMLERARSADPPAQPGYRGGGSSCLGLNRRAVVISAGAAACELTGTLRGRTSLGSGAGFDGQHAAGDAWL